MGKFSDGGCAADYQRINVSRPRSSARSRHRENWTTGAHGVILGAMGSPISARLYWRAVAHFQDVGDANAVSLADALGIEPEEAIALVELLRREGLLAEAEGVVAVSP